MFDSTTKRCSRNELCVHPLGCWLPATTEYFCRDKNKSGGLSCQCKACNSARKKHWKLNNSERSRASDKSYREANADKIHASDKRYYQENRDEIRARQKTYRTNNPEGEYTRTKRWRQNNPKKALDAVRRYRKRHPERVRIQKKQLRAVNPERQREKDREYKQRRLAKIQSLPATFTDIDWQYALNYFHGCCAYCGNPPSLFDHYPTLHQEHFKPLVKGGAYTPDNIIPACQTCNHSKYDKDAKEWIVERFGVRRGNLILKQIEEYFAHTIR